MPQRRKLSTVELVTVAVLRVNGLTYEEIASHFDISMGTLYAQSNTPEAKELIEKTTNIILDRVAEEVGAAASKKLIELLRIEEWTYESIASYFGHGNGKDRITKTLSLMKASAFKLWNKKKQEERTV